LRVGIPIFEPLLKASCSLSRALGLKWTRNRCVSLRLWSYDRRTDPLFSSTDSFLPSSRDEQAFKALQMMGGEGFEGTKGLDSLHDAVRKGEGEEGDGEGRK
jgi:hypothetical protein